MRRILSIGALWGAALALAPGGKALAGELEGEWVKPCAFDATYELYRTERLVFEGDRVLITKEFSDSATCDPIDIVFAGRARYTLGSASAAVAGAQNIDFQFSSVTGVAHTDAAVSAMNELELCGLAGWQRDAERDVSGRVCERSLRNPNVGGSVYHLFRLEGNRFYSGDHYAGPASDGSSPERRPTRLSLSDPFIKR